MGQVDSATGEYGLATPSGIISTTGVGGLTLGCGLGYLSHRYGLAIDNLLSADVVLASGEQVHAGPEEHPDLFWALRGGGGNFGVVTSFEFRLNDVSKIVGGPTMWAVEQSEEVLKAYREFMPSAPRDLYGWFGYVTVHDVDPTETAFSFRDAHWGTVYAGVDPDPANLPAIRDWTVDYFEALHPHSAGGAYVNMMMDEGQERVRASYGDNYERLTRVKATYDPGNLFRVNQNIRPAE